MRVLVFNLSTDEDDVLLAFTTTWVASLAESVEDVSVLTMRAGRFVLPANASVYSLGKELGYSEPRRLWHFYRHLVAIIREHKPEVCFAHMNPLFVVLGAPLLLLFRIPVVLWYAHPHISWQLRVAHRIAARTVASFTRAYPYHKDKLTVIGQGIDTEIFQSRNPEPDGPFTILTVGRLSPIKGQLTLIRAVALVKDQLPRDWRLIVAGGWSGAVSERYFRQMQEEAAAAGITDRISFLGPVVWRELPDLYLKCSVHVNTTVSGSGDKTALEAMSCERPSIVCNEAFFPILGPYYDDLAFAEADPDQLAGKILALAAADRTRRTLIGRYLRQEIVRNHSLRTLTARLVQVLKGVLSGNVPDLTEIR